MKKPSTKQLVWIALLLTIIYSFTKISKNFKQSKFHPTPSILKNPVTSQIPKIIHQTWKTKKLPKMLNEWSQSCRDLHSYEYHLYDDEMNSNFVQLNYPWYFDRYKSFKHDITRVDSIRFMNLHKYGGIFMDVDIECLSSFDKLISSSSSILLSITDISKGVDPLMPNSWLASRN